MFKGQIDFGFLIRWIEMEIKIPLLKPMWEKEDLLQLFMTLT